MAANPLSLLPCPFCGGPADFEECAQGSSVNTKSATWSVGCQNQNEDCIAYQVLASYDRKVEAAEAWNKRASSKEVAEYQKIFDLRWEADMRAINLWRKAHPGHELTWPDHADLVVWLMEELAIRRPQK